MILAIDTTLNTISVCVEKDGKFYEKNSDLRQSAMILIPLIEELLEENSLKKEDISTILVALGPGSFTGIRVGIATGLGLSYALGVKIYGISTLRAMSYLVEEETRIPMIDARRGNIYGASYGKLEVEEVNTSFQDFFEMVQGQDFFGQDVEHFFPGKGRNLENHAKTLIQAYSEGHYTEEIVPNYLREAEAKRRLDEKRNSGN